MICPKCGSDSMNVVSQIRLKEEGKPKTRTPTVYKCTECGHHTEPKDYDM